MLNRWRIEFKGQHVEDIPENLDLNMVYLIGQSGNKWLGVMLCPCMCGETIQLNLLKDSKPCWKIIKHRNNSVTIRPSIWRITNCKSHFYIRKGRIFWCFEE